MGVVYLAHDNERDHAVAIKTIRDPSPSAIARLKREFRSLADVAHPNLVGLHELVADAREQWFFTMDYVEGVDFCRWTRPGISLTDHGVESGSGSTAKMATLSLDRIDWQSASQGLAGSAPAPDTAPVVRPLDIDRLRAAARQLATGVAALHAVGRLHRDLKPSNVLVERETGRVVILDFGLATTLQSDSNRTNVVGTAAYMAPEQATGEVAPASDWYSVGVMLYEALTGTLPHEGPPIKVLIDKQRLDPPAPHRIAAVPLDLSELTMELLARNHRKRPHADEILDRLGGKRVGVAVHASQSVSMGSAFVGRESELETILEAAERAAAGRPTVLHIRGPSGIGKTAIVARALIELADLEDCLTFSGRCFERESVPYKALDHLVDAVAKHLSRLAPEKASALVPGNSASLSRLFPTLRQVPGVRRRPQGRAAHDPGELRREGFAALRELVCNVAGTHRLLVFAVEDLHWGDDDSAALIGELLREPDPPPILWLTTYRPDRENPLVVAMEQQIAAAQRGDVGVDHVLLELEPLDEEEVRRLVHSLMGEESSAVVRAAAEAAGNPFFVAELVRYLQSGAQIDVDAQKITLESMILGRLDILPEDARKLLSIVSLATVPIPQGVAAQACGLGFGEQTALAVLRAARLIRTTGARWYDTVECYHDRVRQAVSGDISMSERVGLHGQLAYALEGWDKADPEVLAEHFLRANERDNARTYFIEAARHAADALAFGRAADLFVQALEIGGVSARVRGELLIDCGDALANAGRGPEAARTFLDAVPLAAARALELQRRAAEQYLVSGHIDDGMAVLERVLEQVDLHVAGNALAVVSSLAFERVRVWARGLSFDEREETSIPPEELTRIDTCWSASIGLGTSDTVRGAEFQTRHLRLALRCGEPYRVARAMATEAMYSATGGSKAHEATQRFVEEANTLAERTGVPHARGLADQANGARHLLEGNFASAIDPLDQSTHVFRRQCRGVVWEITTNEVFAMSALAYLGRLPELAQRLPRLLKEFDELGNHHASTNLRIGHPNLHWLVVDNPDLAEHQVNLAMSHWSQTGYHIQHHNETLARIRIALYRGQHEMAWDLVGQMGLNLKKALMMRVQLIRVEARHARACGAIAQARQEIRPYLLYTAERQAKKLASEGARWASAHAAAILGATAELRERRTEALKHLTSAQRLYAELSMETHALASQYRLGELAGGTDGRRLVETAERGLRELNVANPARMVRVFVP